jgi:hypothetical protein
MGEWRCNLTSALDGCEWSASRFSRFISEERDPVPIEYEAGWGREPIWKLWNRGKFLSPTGNRTPALQPVVRPYTDWAIPIHLWYMWTGSPYVSTAIWEISRRHKPDRHKTKYTTLFLTRSMKQRKTILQWYQYDGVNCAHTARVSMTLLRDVFGDRIISKEIWPPSYTPDYYLWGATVGAVCKHNPHTLLEVKEATAAKSLRLNCRVFCKQDKTSTSTWEPFPRFVVT